MRTDWEQNTVKALKILRTASFRYNFTGSYKKSVGISDHSALSFPNKPCESKSYWNVFVDI